MIFTGNDDIGSMEHIVKEQSFLSAKVNKKKIFSIGDWNGQLPSLPGGLVRKRDGIKYLGEFLGNDVFFF